MNSSTMRRWLPFFLVMSVLAGCRSEQVAFDFGSPSGTARSSSVATASVVAAQPATQPIKNPDKETKPAAADNKLAYAAAVPTTVLPNQPAKASAKLPGPLLQRAIPARQNQRQPAAARPAAQGLENIFFFALAVVLAVLAGLAFAVAAIFSIGFWAALGYVAAGIVVLLLLRALVKKLAGK